ncbi:two-component system response regulator ChvI [Paraburkholderia sp. EB58]|uniref:response regulator n=1 Tax=Paraburkholderia sp. EB58 TaxID=3035125 RepID=UPI003D1D65D0
MKKIEGSGSERPIFRHSQTAMSTVLLVDDDGDTLAAWTEACAQGGYSVLAAADGVAAWNILTTAHVDAVVSDLRMPRMSGGLLCERVREQRWLADRVFILVSGELTPPACVRYDCYMRKPLDFGELFAALRRLLGTR